MSARIDPLGVAAGLSVAVHLAAAAALPAVLDARSAPSPPQPAPVEVELITPPSVRSAAGPVVAEEPPAPPARARKPRRHRALPDPVPLPVPQAAPAAPAPAPQAMAAVPAPGTPLAEAPPLAAPADDLLAPPAPLPSLLDVPIGTGAPPLPQPGGALAEVGPVAPHAPGGAGMPDAGTTTHVARWSEGDALLTPPAPRGSGGSGTDLPFARPTGGYQVKPCYPRSARRAGIEGTVLVKAHLTERGTVDQVEVARSIGHAETDRCATEGVRRWRFEPARRGGDAVSVWVLVPVEYRLR
ncbi:MAG TPA: energy transducer TonB [Thermodesulfobacteriota bacterium]